MWQKSFISLVPVIFPHPSRFEGENDNDKNKKYDIQHSQQLLLKGNVATGKNKVTVVKNTVTVVKIK